MGTVVVIGGGAAGASAAHSLRKSLGKEHRVILVEKEETLVNSPALPLYAVGWRKKENFIRDRALLCRNGLELIAGRIMKIDPALKVVHTENVDIRYDLLLIAAGAGFNRSQPPGMFEGGIESQSLDGADKIRTVLPHFESGEIAIVVTSTGIKCPAAPYEYALLLEDWFRRRERSRDISITLYTPEQAPLALFGQRISEKASGLLLDRKIRVHPGARIKRIDPGGNKIFLDHDSFTFDLLLYHAAPAPPDFIRESGLAGKSGWLDVDRQTMAFTSDDSIFAVGDVTEIQTPSGELLPKLGAVAHLQSIVAAANIAGLMKGQKMGRTYSGFAG